jgi:hypothetical protein
MRITTLRVLAAGVTFAIGVTCSFAIHKKVSSWPALLWDNEYRSCQVKWIGTDGHTVWTPCSRSNLDL